MSPLEPLVQHAVPWFLVVLRLAGIFLFAPFLAGRSIPARVRAMLVTVLAAAVYPALPPTAHAAPDLDLITLIPVVVTELLIGAVIGAIAALPLMAMELGGMIMGYQMGLALARSYNPEADTETEVIAQIVFYLALSCFIMLGGLDAMFLAVLRSFEHCPVGAFGWGSVPFPMYVGVLAAGFELALRVSAPVVGVVFLVMIAVGFVMKTMPQINVMTVGFAVKILAGLVTLAAALLALDQVAGDEISRVISLILNWASSPV